MQLHCNYTTIYSKKLYNYIHNQKNSERENMAKIIKAYRVINKKLECSPKQNLAKRISIFQIYFKLIK
jgi:hypothetical protein